ncbi:uncharacterized protein LOC134810390 [Pan troglodytes]|uniref:uncharacterized protein LOC134810390 n=1 Tax=Pan troglodytes TaxID=9598 RepID=UPI0030137E6B
MMPQCGTEPPSSGLKISAIPAASRSGPGASPTVNTDPGLLPKWGREQAASRETRWKGLSPTTASLPLLRGCRCFLLPGCSTPRRALHELPSWKHLRVPQFTPCSLLKPFLPVSPQGAHGVSSASAPGGGLSSSAAQGCCAPGRNRALLTREHTAITRDLTLLRRSREPLTRGLTPLTRDLIQFTRGHPHPFIRGRSCQHPR